LFVVGVEVIGVNVGSDCLGSLQEVGIIITRVGIREQSPVRASSSVKW
jgi:hypothetical protein